MLRRIARCFFFYGILGLLCFPFGRGLARSEFQPRAFPFAPFSWERGGRIYARLRIREWQGLLPDVSRLFPGLVPRKELKGGDRPQDRLRLLINESCVAELTHLLLCVLGLWAVHILPGKPGVLMWVLYVVFGNLPYIMIQRYNRPMLLKTLERLLARKSARASSEAGAAEESGPETPSFEESSPADPAPDPEWDKTAGQ